MIKIILSFVLGLLSSLLHADDYLVSRDEMIASRNAGAYLIPKLAPAKDAPSIELLWPDLKSSVSSPTQIQLKFIPVSPAEIVPDTFRALYGAFQIDITNRLIPHAELDLSGLTVKQAKLPEGSHKILLKITDSMGRQGAKLIEFVVQ